MEPDTEYLFDQRVVNRNIEQKLITADEKQAFIDSLEDCADRAAQSDTRRSTNSVVSCLWGAGGSAAR